jgi:hypothetical protein
MVRPQSTIATTAIPSVFMVGGLPEFFQTVGPVIEESLEENQDYVGNENQPQTNELPEFFQTGGPTREEFLEELHSDDEDEYTPQPLIRSLANNVYADEQDDGIDNENATHELLDFFHGVQYNDMEEYFRSFEFGETWTSNPIFTDEFAFCALPNALSDIVYEIHTVLQIQRVVPLDWNRNDARYSSLSVPQQTCLRELIHENPAQHRLLDDIHNRLKGYKCRTPYPQIKFLLNKTLDVVEDILRKEVLY